MCYNIDIVVRILRFPLNSLEIEYQIEYQKFVLLYIHVKGVIEMANKRTYGAGTLFKDQDGTWVGRINFTGANGKRKQKVFKSKDKKVVSQKMKDYQLLVAKGEHTLDETYLEPYIKGWLYNVKKNDLKESSFDRAEGTILTHIIPRLGHYQIANLTGEIIQAELINHMSNTNSMSTKKPLSYSSINKAFVYLHSCMEYAIKNRKLRYNPCDTVVLPKSKKKEAKKVRFFDDGEIAQFKEAAISTSLKTKTLLSKYGYAYILDMYTGLRIGELIGLRWHNVDLKNKRILIKEQVGLITDRNDFNDNGNPKRKPTALNDTKGGAERYVPLCKTAFEILEKMSKSCKSQNDYVVSNSQTMLSTNNMIKGYYRICTRAGINNPLGVHTLRHTFASLLFRQNVDVKTVSAILGHRDVSFTYNTYIHIIESQKIIAVEKLDSI